MLGIIPHRFPFPEYTPQTRADVLHTCIKMNNYFRSHDCIQVSVSGGSDSDCMVHLICTYFPEYVYKCRFVFSNTGLEWKATLQHLTDMENRYNIKIDRVRGVSVVTACRQYGFPILSKFKSHFIDLYLRDKPSGAKIIFYDGIKSYHAMQFTENQKKLVSYLKDNGIKVSDKCCELSKKKPLTKYAKEQGCDMVCTGERVAEGGRRALAHKSCFEENNSHAKMDKFMPLLWWSDETKAEFKEKECIRYSDCYEVYGLRRTGCVGCPFNLNVAADLQTMQLYEPNLYKACMNVFGESYRLMDEFKCRKKKCLPEPLQYPFDIEKEESK